MVFEVCVWRLGDGWSSEVWGLMFEHVAWSQCGGQ